MYSIRQTAKLNAQDGEAARNPLPEAPQLIGHEPGWAPVRRVSPHLVFGEFRKQRAGGPNL
jgi:hypothetical protein